MSLDTCAKADMGEFSLEGQVGVMYQGTGTKELPVDAKRISICTYDKLCIRTMS